MKFLCPGCDRLVELESFRLERERLVITCPRCGKEEALPEIRGPSPEPRPPPPVLAVSANERPPVHATGKQSPGGAPVPVLPVVRASAVSWPPAPFDADPFGVPEGHCPKCAALRRSPEGACSSCGLMLEQLRPTHLSPSSWLASAWPTLISSWNDPNAHAGLLAAAAPRGELSAVGRLYRLRLARIPGDVLAERGRDEVLRLAAIGPLEALPKSLPLRPEKIRFAVMVGVMVFLLLLGGYTLWRIG